MVYNEIRGVGHCGSGSLGLEEVCQGQQVPLGSCFYDSGRWLTASIRGSGIRHWEKNTEPDFCF